MRVSDTYILHVDAVATWLDGNAIVSSLVHEICQRYVFDVHGVETVGILHPAYAVGLIDRCRIIDHVIEVEIGAIHDIERPQRWILHKD